MSRARTAAALVLSLRIAYGGALVGAPQRLTGRWLGPAAGQGPTQLLARALGVREVLLHAGGLAAALRGDAVRPWLAASIVGDLSDVLATLAARRELPDSSPAATAVVAGGSALLSAAAAVAVER
jgi:hypothetical protein